MGKHTLLFVGIALLAAGLHGENIRFQNRVIGGTPATLGQFPYVVGLKPRAPDQSNLPICAGTILDGTHVLTEAWCVRNLDDLTIIAGCIDWHGDCEVYEIASYEIHPDWVGQEGSNDVAVITVATEMAMSDNVQSVELSLDNIGADVAAVQVGWTSEVGLTDLRWAEVETVMEETCLKEWFGKDETNICTQPGGVTIWGDYGGPLLVDGKQVGILILDGEVDLQIRVEYYLDFINGAIKKLTI